MYVYYCDKSIIRSLNDYENETCEKSYGWFFKRIKIRLYANNMYGNNNII